MSRWLAAAVAGLAGVAAFNVIIGVFGLGRAITGFAVFVVLTLWLARRAQPEDAEGRSDG